jgi:hypothetical protein
MMQAEVAKQTLAWQQSVYDAQNQTNVQGGGNTLQSGNVANQLQQAISALQGGNTSQFASILSNLDKQAGGGGFSGVNTSVPNFNISF